MNEAYDIKAHLVSFLSSKTGTAAYGQVPKDRPDEFITVDLTGEASDWWRDSATVAIQCWSTSDSRAAKLSLTVKAAMFDFQFERHVRKCTQNRRYAFPDPDSRQARYQIVFDIVTQP